MTSCRAWYHWKAQATTALAYVGATVIVDGSTAQLTGGNANWSLNVTKQCRQLQSLSRIRPGQNVYTGTVAVNPGTQSFTWNGRGNDGRLWPDGAYTLTATAVDTNKQSVAISEVQAIVDSVDLTQDPPQLSINGQNYTLDKIKRIVRPTT
ncbi:MAG: FLgD tudor-like domain-containing protein [Pseudolabrys sp.]